ncbi:MAG: hypothetical protein J5972_04065 [Eubacterium sp.]|nr:hypothetical protein [Eubacterium sp.]
MRKIVVACYAVCSALLLGLLIYVNFNMSVDETNEREDKGYKTVENVREREIKDDTAPIGIRKEYIFDVPAIKRGGETLAFLNYHQNVQVYIAENLIYERKVNENNLFGKTTGHDWVAVLLYPGDSSNQVRVVGTPVYKSAAESEMTFQIGSKFSIWKMLFG